MGWERVRRSNDKPQNYLLVKQGNIFKKKNLFLLFFTAFTCFFLQFLINETRPSLKVKILMGWNEIKTKKNKVQYEMLGPTYYMYGHSTKN